MPRITKSEKELTEAIRLTVEYVGMKTLPPIVGWSWFDALVKYDPELAQKMRNEWEQMQINAVRGLAVDHGSDIKDVPVGPIQAGIRAGIADNPEFYKTETAGRYENREQQIQSEHREKIARSKSYGLVHYFENEFGNSRLLCNNNHLITALGTHVQSEVTCPECVDILLNRLKAKAHENKRATILRTAESLINGDRADTYGPPEVSFGRIGRLLSAMGMRWLEADGEIREVNAEDVSLALTQLKISRIISSRDHEDSWIDAAGYIALGGEMATRYVAENGEPSVD